jgi:hypothetical protein
MKNKVKRQHYVPQFYLKRWARDVSNTQIWVYDKNLKKAFSNSIQSVASSNYFYDFPDVTQEQMNQMVQKIEETIKDEMEKEKALEYIQGQLYEKALSKIEAINCDLIVKNATSQIYVNPNDFSLVEKRLSDTPSIGDKNWKRISFGSIDDGR